MNKINSTFKTDLLSLTINQRETTVRCVAYDDHTAHTLKPWESPLKSDMQFIPDTDTHTGFNWVRFS